MVGNGSHGTSLLDPEVVPLAQRRRFSAGEKLRILEAADACTKPGELGALVRREGIYSSYLSRWRRARDRGQLDALGPGKRGRKPLSDAALAREMTRLRRDKERLQARLDQAEAIIELQKKLSQLLGPSVKDDEINGRP
jgi:transposase-like protein